MHSFLKYIALFALTSVACLKGHATDIEKTLSLDGLQRKYLVHLPTDYASAKNLSVIFALHGGGGNYHQVITQYNLNPLADKNNFIVVYPDAMNKSWSMKGVSSRVKSNDQDIDDVHFISVLIDTIAVHYKGDVKNVFCTGISRGGIFSLFLASKLSGRIKGIAPVCASIPRSIIDSYTFIHPTPVLLINGTADPLISYTGGPGKFNNITGDAEQYDMLPTEELVKKITGLNNCSNPPDVYSLPDVTPGDGCTAIKYTYTCNNTTVKFIKVINGGHTWPGGTQYLPKFIIGKLCLDFKAEDEIFGFFMAAK